jgi:hypothetical protein
MPAKFTIERRDPYSPLLRLGTTLGAARRAGHSGWVEVRDHGRVHGIRLARGAIAEVRLDSGSELAARATEHASGMLGQAAGLFDLPRPHVIWNPESAADGDAAGLDPTLVVMSGVTARRDLFEPRALVERIPVQTLVVGPERLAALKRTRTLSARELEFLAALRRPTPIPMILWKRGLEPRHAGALLVALNLVGLWDAQWSPGALPRITAAARVVRALDARTPDHALFGLGEEPDPKALDKAYRRLSLELHPDRLRGLPPEELALAERAFVGASEAYQRLRRTRRRRPVRDTGGATLGKVELARQPVDGWSALLDEARRASRRGDQTRARAFALKALAKSPPTEARAALTAILRRAA